jgi:hypothetical protein
MPTTSIDLDVSFGGAGTPGFLVPSPDATILNIGPCDVNTITTVPTPTSGAAIAPVVGSCFVLLTGDGEYSVMKINSANASAISFQFLLQDNLSNRFH